eukprot:gene13677-16163_t
MEGLELEFLKSGALGTLHINDTLILQNAAEVAGGGMSVSSGAKLVVQRGDNTTSGIWNHAAVEVGCGNYSVCVWGNVGSEAAAILLNGIHGAVLEDTLVAWNEGWTQKVEEKEKVSTTVMDLNGAEATVHRCRFDRNQGSALAVYENSTIRVSATDLFNNSAQDGAGLHVDRTSSAEVAHCSFRNGVAENGGAVHASGNLSVVHSWFEANTAYRNGGCLYLSLRQQSTTVSDCEFEANQAASEDGYHGNGGVMYLHAYEEYQMGGVASETGGTLFEALTYRSNRAVEGGAIGFWQPEVLSDALEEPPCYDCTLEGSGNVAAYGSSDGWATAALYLRVRVDAMQMEEEAGKSVQHNITVQVIDAGGEVVVVDSSTVDIHFVNMEECEMLEGAVRQQVQMGTVVFSGKSSGLALKGKPGTQCEIYFTSDFGGLYSHVVTSNVTVVPLQYCQPGEELHGDTWQTCEECPVGSLSLDNSSACLECTKELECSGDESDCPIHCPGGNAYVVCEGSWIAPQAHLCGSDTQCFLDRVYKCEQEDACTTGEKDTCDEAVGRSGYGAASVVSLQVCNSGPYSDSVVLCGSQTPVTCSTEGYFSAGSGEECLQCPPRSAVLTQIVFVLLAVVVAVSAVFRFMRSMGSTFTTDTLNLSPETRQVLKDIVAITLGYLQVMTQMSDVFRDELMPSSIRGYTGSFKFVNLDLMWLVNLPCISYYASNSTSSYWPDLYWAISSPYIICCVFIVLHQGINARHKWLRRAAPPGTDDSAEIEQDLRRRQSLRSSWEPE